MIAKYKAIVLFLFLQTSVFSQDLGKAYFAGGCFWCMEESFEKKEGVIEVVSGYSGGTTTNPTYKEVTYGNTGHFETIEIIFDKDKIALCDRENFRVQIFDFDGNYLDQWHFHRPIAIYSDQYSKEIYVAEAGAPEVQAGVPNLGLRVAIVNEKGEMISSFGKGTLGEQPDQLIGPHGIAVDNEGSVYIAEVSFTAYGSNQDPQREVVSLRKWKRS